MSSLPRSDTAALTRTLDWEAVRRAYVPQQPLLNLNNAAVSPPTRTAQDAALEALRFIGENPDVNMWSKLDAGLPLVKERLAVLIGCRASEIALNRNSSEGLSTAIFGIPLVAGDHVLVCSWDYPSVLGAWRQRRAREGIEIVEVRFPITASDDEILDAYRAAVTKRTRVMQITHMLHWNGRLLPAGALCELARGHGVISVVDGAQTFAQVPIDLRELRCDFFVTSLHKWLGAPVGNGMLVVRDEMIDKTWPLLGPFDPPPLRIDKFDHWNLGTYNSALQAGILPAIELHETIGARAAQARLKDRTLFWVERARDIPGFRLHSRLEGDGFGSITLFALDGIDCRRLETALRDQYRVHTKYRKVGGLEGIRVSPHLYTSDEELDRFVRAVREIAEASVP